MDKNSIVFVGLDTHKEFTEVVYWRDQRGGDFHQLGRVKSTKPAIGKLARDLQSKYPAATLHSVYEAGPCGYWIYRCPARISTDLQVRQEGLPKDIIDCAWKAQLRLCRRYQRLLKKGKPYNVIVTAIAREMIAYIWSISREVVLPRVDPKQRISRVPA